MPATQTATTPAQTAANKVDAIFVSALRGSADVLNADLRGLATLITQAELANDKAEVAVLMWTYNKMKGERDALIRSTHIVAGT